MAVAVYVQICYEQVLGMPVPDLRKVVNVTRITIAVISVTARREERITEDGQLASIAIPVCVRVRECNILIFRNVYCIWQTFKMCPYVTLVAL